MATIVINGSGAGNALETMLGAEDITPGDAPSYQLCKTIYAYHPLGAKLAEKPIALAQSKKRKISVSSGPEGRVVEAFEKKWNELGCDATIFNLMALSRVYGVASVALLVDGVESNQPVDLKTLYKKKFSFNVYDPLNTAGSLVINQQPNALDFMKSTGIITVAGKTYHQSRCCVMMNEQPLYIDYTTSAFGFVGRSVYQRTLFPLKSFIATMRTDDMVALKAGVIVARLKQPGSIIDRAMTILFNLKRELIQQAQTYNVISVDQEDSIESLNLQNLDGPLSVCRKNILENIAAGADDMPASLLNQETMAEGFGEGSEDAKMVAHFVDRTRYKMDPAYRFMDPIVQHLAWTPEFFDTLKKDFPEEYADADFKAAFSEWQNSFKTEWPSFLEEPPSEQVLVDDVRLKAVIALVQVLMPALDPDNKAATIMWAVENFNTLKLLFGASLELDYDALKSYVPPEAAATEPQPKPFAAQDAAPVLGSYDTALDKLLAVYSERQRPKPRAVRA